MKCTKQPKTSTPRGVVYDAEYFIKKFTAIPAKRWTTETYSNDKGQYCALGHCLRKPALADSAQALREIFEDGLRAHVQEVNDFPSERFPQKTPRARILAALRALKKAGGK